MEILIVVLIVMCFITWFLISKTNKKISSIDKRLEKIEALLGIASGKTKTSKDN